MVTRTAQMVRSSHESLGLGGTLALRITTSPFLAACNRITQGDGTIGRSLAVRILGSALTAVALMVAVGVVLAGATLAETHLGTSWVRWHVYRSTWFSILLALVGLNVTVSALRRFPWQRNQTGFLLTHLGILILLAGCWQTRRGGLDGQMTLTDGKTAGAITLKDRSEIRFRSQSADEGAAGRISFGPGPSDWPERKSLELGMVDGLAVRARSFLQRARREAGWQPDATGIGPPVLQLSLLDSQERQVASSECVAGPFNAEQSLGPLTVRFLEATAEAMLTDFKDPPNLVDRPQGTLVAYYRAQRAAIDVQTTGRQSVPIGSTGASVTITNYLPHATMQADGRVANVDRQPKNPVVELTISLPGRPHPTRELAFAASPMVSFAKMRGEPVPVRFWYYHRSEIERDRIEFLQTADGRLHGRESGDGSFRFLGEVTEGQVIDWRKEYRLRIDRRVLHGRQTDRYVSAGIPIRGASRKAAIELEFHGAGNTQTVWLQRGGQEQTVVGKSGPLTIAFGKEQLPLGFALHMVSHRHSSVSDGAATAQQECRIRLSGRTSGTHGPHRLAHNHPLKQEGWVIYLQNIQTRPDGEEEVSLRIVRDPGRWTKYLGSLFICLGTLIVFARRLTWLDSLTNGRSNRTILTGKSTEPTIRPGEMP